MSQTLNSKIAAIGIDIGKNSFHIVGQDRRGALVLRQKWSRGQVEARLANLPPCLIGMEACAGAHHLSRKLQALGHDARLMPAKYVRPYSKGDKNDYRDAEAIAEAVQRPTMKFVATKSSDFLESGRYSTLRELAQAEKINESYLARILRLTLLSPSITEAILSGRQPNGLELARLLTPFPIEWKEQEDLFLQYASLH
jgi:transposase